MVEVADRRRRDVNNTQVTTPSLVYPIPDRLVGNSSVQQLAIPICNIICTYAPNSRCQSDDGVPNPLCQAKNQKTTQTKTTGTPDIEIDTHIPTRTHSNQRHVPSDSPPPLPKQAKCTEKTAPPTNKCCASDSLMDSMGLSGCININIKN
jgi:hypothetical protein